MVRSILFLLTLLVVARQPSAATNFERANKCSATKRSRSASLTQLRAIRTHEPQAIELLGEVWFGGGCFWERQYEQVKVEMDPFGSFNRMPGAVTSVVGYGGARGRGDDGLVCYDTGMSNEYGALGYCEVVRTTLDSGKEVSQFSSLVDNFFSSFTPTKWGFARPDLPPLLPIGDQGAPYRSVIGIPGGVNGPLFKVLVDRNKPRGPYNLTLTLKEDKTGNMTSDENNTVWVMDSTVFPFYQGEQYHQYHSNFFHNPKEPPEYAAWYIDDLYHLKVQQGRIPKTGCPDSACPLNSNVSGCHW